MPLKSSMKEDGNTSAICTNLQIDFCYNNNDHRTVAVGLLYHICHTTQSRYELIDLDDPSLLDKLFCYWDRNAALFIEHVLSRDEGIQASSLVHCHYCKYMEICKYLQSVLLSHIKESIDMNISIFEKLGFIEPTVQFRCYANLDIVAVRIANAIRTVKTFIIDYEPFYMEY